MRPEIEEKLLTINREFYQTFTDAFANSRHQPQPGTFQLMEAVGFNQSIVDLGCGNGALADALHDRGHRGLYLGVDNSPGLLERAQHDCSHPHAEFILADLAQPNWSNALPNQRFPWVFALAMLHHIPGNQRRQDWAGQLQQILTDDGFVGISVWNFSAEKRWRERVLPWSTVGISAEEVDDGDALLDWRRSGRGLRYVHQFQIEELTSLAAVAGCRVIKQFEAGGESGHLNRLQLWQRLPSLE